MPNPLIVKGILKLLSVAIAGDEDTVRVSSTCLREVSYNLTTKVLTVTFTESGATYEYYGVPESDYEQLVNTFGSVGEIYNETIKGSYNYLRVG